MSLEICGNCAKSEARLQEALRVSLNRKNTIRRMAKELDALRSAISDARRGLRDDRKSHREAREAAYDALKIDYSKLRVNDTGGAECCLG